VVGNLQVESGNYGGVCRRRPYSLAVQIPATALRVAQA